MQVKNACVQPRGQPPGKLPEEPALMKVCVVCEELFDARRSAITCSIKCRKERVYVRQRCYQLNNRQRWSEWAHRYYLENREHISELHRRYYLKNHKRTVERARRNYLKNRERISKKHRRYRLENPNYFSEYRRDYQPLNHAYILSQQRLYYDKIRAFREVHFEFFGEKCSREYARHILAILKDEDRKKELPK
jgi:hypothetical protein